MSDLFSAGQETVKTTLQWGILFMLHNPEVQAKIQEELDAVVGRKRLPNLSDAPFLPYTEATICEILRRSNVAGLGTTHATTWSVFFTSPSNTTNTIRLNDCYN
jgi:26-hydroxylase